MKKNIIDKMSENEKDSLSTGIVKILCGMVGLLIAFELIVHGDLVFGSTVYGIIVGGIAGVIAGDVLLISGYRMVKKTLKEDYAEYQREKSKEKENTDELDLEKEEEIEIEEENELEEEVEVEEEKSINEKILEDYELLQEKKAELEKLLEEAKDFVIGTEEEQEERKK